MKENTEHPPVLRASQEIVDNFIRVCNANGIEDAQDILMLMSVSTIALLSLIGGRKALLNKYADGLKGYKMIDGKELGRYTTIN